MMRNNIRKILREFIEDHSNMNDYVDYAQEKAEKTSDYPAETKKVDNMKNKIKNKVEKAYKEVTGEEPVNDDNIVIKVDDNIKDGKIGSFKHPENKKDLGILKIHPKALNNTEYVEDIIKHELIHGACGIDNLDCRNHKGDFQKIANKVGLPKKYRH